MSGLVRKVWDGIRAAYTRQVVNELNKYGLRYQDLLCEDPLVAKAVARLSPEEKVARERRIKRAIDLSMKKKYLPEEIVKVQGPMKAYLKPYLDEVTAEEKERQLLNP